MKTLTDKIIECLKDKYDHWIGSQENNETQAENKGFKQGLDWAIDTIKSLEISTKEEYLQYSKDNIDKIFEHIPDANNCKTVIEAYLIQQINYLKNIEINH